MTEQTAPPEAPNDALTPGEITERTGVSIDTLRYYEREGLLRNVGRASNGHRRYSDDDVFWVQVLRCLRDTGMSIEDLRQYCDLGEQGEITEPERYSMLTAHRQLVERQVADLQRALELLDHKLAFYPQHQQEDTRP